MWFIIILSFLATIYYFLGIKPYKYWKEKEVAYIKPLPLIGNLGPIAFRQQSISELMNAFYCSHPNERFVGVYQFLRPTLFIRDPELIRKIGVKEFDSFADHRALVPDESDPLWNRNLFSLRGEKWHNMRVTLSPSFTSSKMKMMFELMKQCGTQFVNYLLENSHGEVLEMEMKDTFCRYTTDVIASTAFGITCDSLKNKKNDFYVLGKDAIDLNGVKAFKGFMYSLSPRLMKWLNIGMFTKKQSNFFRGIINENLKIRREQRVVRPDMIHLLLEAQKGNLQKDDLDAVPDSGFAIAQEAYTTNKAIKSQKAEISDEDITANAFLFFLAGFETSSNLLSLTAYELALNPDIQQELYKEIAECHEKCNGSFTYEAILGMKYLDMVVSESLRKWPPLIVADRIAVKTFTIESEMPNKKAVTLEKGTNVWIPIYPLHRDSKYYPNPEKFDPERFSEINRHKIQPFTYMPFGIGPRNCIGSRFALLESKLLLAELLHKFEIIPVEKTQIPLTFKKGSIVSQSEKGVWVGFNPRDTFC